MVGWDRLARILSTGAGPRVGGPPAAVYKAGVNTDSLGADMTLLILSQLGCNRGPGADAINLDWKSGEVFHVAASYQNAAVMTEETPASLDGSVNTGFGEDWSDEVIWTYEVVETGLIPSANDPLYAYSVRFDGEQTSLAVIRAYLDETLNSDDALLESDPVIYLVFREDRDRLAGLVSFTDVDGERVEKAYSSTELGKSWNNLSQSELTMLPTMLAPFGTTWADGAKTLENGDLAESYSVDAGITDVAFDDTMGGGLVVTRYEDGQPWPTYTATDNMEARLLSSEEVDAKRADAPYLSPEAPEDFDYRAALSASIDIDAALRLSPEDIEGWKAEVYEGYRPWAGSWWKQAEGALVFGYDGRDTYSDEIKEQVDPIKTDMDKLSKELRDMDDGADKDAKVEEYRAKQKELVELLVGFYKSVREDLDGGRIVVEDGKMTHTEDGWSYALAELSPMDKMALRVYGEGNTTNNPFFMPAWELLNHYSPAGGSWWGHCNGWAAAAILTDEPRESKTVDIMGQQVAFTTADQKGLLTEAHYSQYSRFYGARYNGEEDDISDLHPPAFHQIISFYLKEQGVPFVFDTTAGDAVWNYPAWAAEVEMTEVDNADSGKVNVNTATMEELAAVEGIDEGEASRIVETREAAGPFQDMDAVRELAGDAADSLTIDQANRTYDVVATVTFTTDSVGETHLDFDEDAPKGFDKVYRYTLVTDLEGNVLEGTWDDDKEHPDFAWVPYSNPRSSSNGNSENPFLEYGDVLNALGDDLERH